VIDETLTVRGARSALVPGIDTTLRQSVRDLHAHLDATATYPVTEAANRWLGEAQAVAADAVAVIEAADTVDDSVFDTLETRLQQVSELLAEVDETDSAEANEHVRAACDLVDEILAEL